MEGVRWPDEVDEIITGDLTAALAYVTPAGGAVVTAVAPIGLRDRETGTVSFTTSLGFGRKLERISRNPRVALAYHAREHGFASRPDFVLVQGEATAQTEPDRRYLEDVVGPHSERFMGPPRRGKLFWDRWLQEYYGDRVPVEVKAARVIDWPDQRAEGEPAVYGSPLPDTQPAPQAPPANGTGPRLDAERAAKRLKALPHQLLAFVGSDGYPEVVPVEVTAASAGGIELRAGHALPPGGRRAGVLAHSYRAHLIGLAARGHTGWMSVGEDPLVASYAPHTEFGFRAPANKTLLLLANGLLAKRGLRQATRKAAAA
jgi:Pyridoxamine 5'-phosphate oxidase